MYNYKIKFVYLEILYQKKWDVEKNKYLKEYKEYNVNILICYNVIN